MRKINFSPGPAALPAAVVARIFTEARDWQGRGVSIMEVSHRSDAYLQLHEELLGNLRAVLGIPASHEILLMPGGARGQFSAVPLNLAAGRGLGGVYLISGYWSALAGKTAAPMIEVFPMLMDAADSLLLLPSAEEISAKPPNATTDKVQRQGAPGSGSVAAAAAATAAEHSDNLKWRDANELLGEYASRAAYVHCCYNETIDGVQLPGLFRFTRANTSLPLAMDVSSGVAAAPLDFGKVDLAYACAQKNLGIPGLTLVSIKRELLELEPSSATPSILSYRAQQKAGSMVNTPDTFASFVCNLVCEWIMEQGGVEQLAKINRRKAKHLYQVIDASDGFYQCRVAAECRSITNVVFHLATEELERRFLAAAEAADMINLKGHRVHGGIRASIYNAITEEEVMRLCEFMRDFMHKHR